MAQVRSWFAAVSVALLAAASALAGDARCTAVQVKNGRTEGTDVVTAKGVLSAPGDVVTPSGIEFRCGAFAEVIPAADVRVTRTAITYKAKKGKTSGLVSLSVSLKSGKFSLSAKKVEVGDLDEDPVVPFVLDVGRQRVSALYPLGGAGAKRAWKQGQPFQVDLALRVLEVSHTGGNAVLTPATGLVFDAAAATPPAGIRVIGDPDAQVGDDGVIRARVEVTDPAVLQRVDVQSIFGQPTGVTDPPASRVTAGDDGESEAVTFVEQRSTDASTLMPGASAQIVVDGVDGSPSGVLTVPAGAVAAPLPGVRFTPLSFAVQLPAPVPDGYTPVAGAEISATNEATFVAANAPTVALGRPRWVDREALAESDLRLLAFVDGTWTEVAGRGAYDGVEDRIGPDGAEPARVPGTGVVVWATRSATVAAKDRAVSRRKVVRGRVVNSSGTPLRSQAVLTRAGAMVTGSDGAFSVDRAAIAADSLEVIQAVGDTSSTSRVVSAAEAAGTVEIRAPGDGPLEIKFGTVSGTIFEEGGVVPSPGATVTIELASAVRGLVLDDRGTPTELFDDVLSVPDLSDIGVHTFAWHLRIPDDDAEFTSAVTGPSVSPTDLILEAQAAGRVPGEGAYTVRVSYVVPVVGELSLYAGFRVTVDGISPGVSDVQLPAAVEVTARKTVAAGADGRFAALLRAPVGIPMTATAVRSDEAKTDDRSFQFDVSVERDFVFPVDSDVPVPAGTLQNQWVARAPMLEARSRAGSVVLGGKIWVAGGHAADGTPLASLEVYDPLADAWTAKAPMSVARDRCALAVARGKIFAVGGWDGTQLLRSVEVYDPAANSWSPAAPMIATREDAKAAVAGSRLFVMSGTTSRGSPSGDPSASVEVYDLDEGSWSVGPEMPTALVGGDAVTFGGRIHVRGDGGVNGSQAVLDPDTGIWTVGAGADGGRSVHPGFCEGAGELWVVDGDAAGGALLTWDPETDTYGAHPASPRGREYGCAESAYGVIYSIGGDVGGVASASVDAFRPAWVRRTDMPTARTGLAAAAVDAQVWVAGGSDGTASVANLESYDPSRNVWTSRAPMLEAREEFGLVAVDGKLYAVGGVSRPSGTVLSSVEMYDPLTGQWTARAPMSVARSGAAVVAVGGRIYAAGGGDATVEVYNPATDAWSARASMGVARARTAGATNGTFLFVVGGSDGANTLVNVEAFNPGTLAWSGRNNAPGACERHAMAGIGGKLWTFGGHNVADEGIYGTALRWVFQFEVTANRWTGGPLLPRAVRNPAAASLDGVLYVVGGRGSRGGTDHYDGFDRVYRVMHAYRPE